jgi:hypothetical protein
MGVQQVSSRLRAASVFRRTRYNAFHRERPFLTDPSARPPTVMSRESGTATAFLTDSLREVSTGAGTKKPCPLAAQGHEKGTALDYSEITPSISAAALYMAMT